MSFYLSVGLHLSVSASVYRSVCLAVCLCVCALGCLSVCVPICLSVYFVSLVYLLICSCFATKQHYDWTKARSNLGPEPCDAGSLQATAAVLESSRQRRLGVLGRTSAY